jgi:hypothetical protein
MKTCGSTFTCTRSAWQTRNASALTWRLEMRGRATAWWLLVMKTDSRLPAGAG